MTYFNQKLTSVLYISSWWTLKSWVLVVCHPQHWNKLINVWLSYTSHHWSLDIAQWFLIFEFFCLLLRYLQAAVSLSDIVVGNTLKLHLISEWAHASKSFNLFFRTVLKSGNNHRSNIWKDWKSEIITYNYSFFNIHFIFWSFSLEIKESTMYACSLDCSCSETS